MKHTISLILAILFAVPTFAAQDDYLVKKDSLLKVINIAEGEAKFAAYDHLGIILFNDASTPADTFLKYNTEFEQAATAAKDSFAMKAAKHRMILWFRNNAKHEELLEILPATLDFMKTGKYYNKYIQEYNFFVMTLFELGKFDEAMKIANQFYSDAKTIDYPTAQPYALYTLGELYNGSKRLEDACKSYLAALQILKITKDTYTLQSYIYASLIDCYTELKRWKDVEKYFNEWEMNLKKAESNKWETKILRCNFYQINISFYDEIKDYAKAEKYCKLLEKPENITDYYMGSIANHRVLYYLANKNYSAVLEWALKGYDLETKRNKLVNRCHFLQYAAQAALLLGKAEEGAEYLERFVEFNDSLHNIEFNAKIDELRIQYDVDKHIAEKTHNRNYFLFALGGCILLLVTLGIWIFYSRQIVLRNRELVRKNQQWANLQTLEIVGKDKDMEIEKNMPAAEDYEIVEQAHRILLDGLFKEYELVLDTLAVKMGIHSKTLSQVINSVTGKNFNQFVNEYRIKEAIRIMSHEKDLRLKEIYWQVGFNSYTAFYRTFKQITGLHPTQFKNKDSEMKE
ncbi:MAG: helix-turn-helix domain-containing protein [Prevotellaceae bacterium]|jgi:pentatricopeptide repeat protein|nr:helix-turn-helix domain-containing protein [Prevotellaceae bacterium]